MGKAERSSPGLVKEEGNDLLHTSERIPKPASLFPGAQIRALTEEKELNITRIQELETNLTELLSSQSGKVSGCRKAFFSVSHDPILCSLQTHL